MPDSPKRRSSISGDSTAGRLDDAEAVTGTPPSKCVVVEGRSDRRAVVSAAWRFGRRLEDEGVAVVAMGGATNVHSYVSEIRNRWPGTELSGLCDQKELNHFGRALLGMDSIGDVDVSLLSRNGVFVCIPDLEAELIRAAGAEGVMGVIAELGEEDSFTRFSNQPEWRERDVGERLKRFMGTRSGRKVLYAGLVTAAIPVSSIPRPLTMLLDHLASTGT